MGVLVLCLLAGFLAILSLLLFTACRIHAKLWLETAGGYLELHVSYLLPVKSFRFRVYLFSAPYLAIDWLKEDGTVQTIFRAFEKKKPVSPWADALRDAVRWRRVSAYLEAGDDAEPALSALTYGALYHLLRYLLQRYLTPEAVLDGMPSAGDALFRLKVEGIATLSPAQIILKRLQKKRRKQHVTPN